MEPHLSHIYIPGAQRKKGGVEPADAVEYSSGWVTQMSKDRNVRPGKNMICDGYEINGTANLKQQSRVQVLTILKHREQGAKAINASDY